MRRICFRTPSSVPCHVGLSAGLAITAHLIPASKLRKPRERMRVHVCKQDKLIVLYHLISEVLSILSVRRASLGPAHTRAEGSHKGMNTRKWGMQETILEVYLPHSSKQGGSRKNKCLGLSPFPPSDLPPLPPVFPMGQTQQKLEDKGAQGMQPTKVILPDQCREWQRTDLLWGGEGRWADRE